MAAIAVLEERAIVRWAEIAETYVPGVTGDRGWEDLADAIARVDAARYDVTAVLPATAAALPLPRHTATELTYRLYGNYPASLPSLTPTEAAAVRLQREDTVSEYQDRDGTRHAPPADRPASGFDR